MGVRTRLILFPFVSMTLPLVSSEWKRIRPLGIKKPKMRPKDQIRIGKQQKIYLHQLEGNVEERLEHTKIRKPFNFSVRKQWRMPSHMCPCENCQRKRIRQVRLGKLPPEVLRDIVPEKTQRRMPWERKGLLQEGEIPPLPTDGTDDPYPESNPIVLKRWLQDLDRWEKNAPIRWKCKECGRWNRKRMRGRNFCVECGQIYGAARPLPGPSATAEGPGICKYHQTSNHGTRICPLLNMHRVRLSRITKVIGNLTEISKNLTMLEVARMGLLKQYRDFGKNAYGGRSISAPLPSNLRNKPAAKHLSIRRELLLTAPVPPLSEPKNFTEMDPGRVRIAKWRDDPRNPWSEKPLDGKTLRYLWEQKRYEKNLRVRKEYNKKVRKLAKQHPALVDDLITGRSKRPLDLGGESDNVEDLYA